MDSVDTRELEASCDEPDQLLFQSFKVSCAQLGPFLIDLNCSLLPASNLTNYDASIECYFCLSDWQEKCWP